MPSKPAAITITGPRLFKAGAVVIIHGYGVLLALPIVAAVLVVSVMKFGILTALIPLLAVAGMAYFLPFGFGNLHVVRLVRSIVPIAGRSAEGFVVQLTLSPRLRTGLRAVLEDADDIGYLSLTDTDLVFEGDSVKLTLPFERIERVEPRNIGLRVPFIHGWRMRLAVTGLPGVESVEFAERSSGVLTRSRAITRKLYASLAAKMSPAAKP